MDSVVSFADIGQATRERLAKQGKAMPDGSYPIRNVADLKNAIRAYGRASEADRAKVRRHIIKRARALGKSELIPDNWKMTRTVTAAAMPPAPASSSAPAGMVTSRQRLIRSENARLQPRDARGRFRLVLARLKQNLGSSEQLQSVLKKVEKVENLENAGNYSAAQREAARVLSLVDRIDAGMLERGELRNVREGAAALGGALANLPLPFGEEGEKVRYSDLPPVLKNLIEGMMTRVKDKIGDDADEANSKLASFKRGGDMLTQMEISSELSKLMRLLT
jgi:hypothetical protein